MLLPVNQHFIAYHALTSEVQSLLTKPRFDSLPLTLIRPQNLKAKLKSHSNSLVTTFCHFIYG